MKPDEILKLKREYTKKGIEYWISELIKKQEALLFNQIRLEELTKLEKLSEDEKKQRDTELPVNIDNAKFEVKKAEVHIEGLQRLLVSYEENKPLKV